MLESGLKKIDTTLCSCSREEGSVAYISIRSPESHVVNTIIQLDCSTRNGEKLKTLPSSLLLNCRRKLNNSSATSRSVVSSTIIYPVKCEVTVRLVGDVIQTTWDCLESDCSFLLPITIGDGAQCYVQYYHQYCIKEKCQEKPWDLDDLLNTSVNSNLTAQDVSYVRLKCHHHCLRGKNYISPLVGRRTSQILATVMCPHSNVHLSKRENCRHFYDVQRNASICADGQCYNSNNSVDMTSASGLEPLLQNVGNSTADCYVEQSSHTIILQ